MLLLTSANAVVNTAVLANIGCVGIDFVIWQIWVVLPKVARDRSSLIGWGREVVGESSPAPEELQGRVYASIACLDVVRCKINGASAFAIINSLVLVKPSLADCSDIWASTGLR